MKPYKVNKGLIFGDNIQRPFIGSNKDKTK
ncbi:hypothetical protein Xind_02922 [Xenorhabdus indica]|nr:hypothetical protein [Xenorhabdus indica]